MCSCKGDCKNVKFRDNCTSLIGKAVIFLNARKIGLKLIEI